MLQTLQAAVLSVVYLTFAECLQVGDLVYCRITSAERDLDPVLACSDVQGKVCTFACTLLLLHQENVSSRDK